MGEELIYKNQDCIEFLKSLESRSVDLICTDPPYYRVVNDEWDNQWFTIDQYYEWCEQWITELGRVAKWSCSFWLFGFPQQLCTLLPVIERAGFTFRQQIVVNKGMQAVAGRTSDKLKMFPTATESIFFFHYEARDHIRDLLQSERKRLGWKGCDVNGFLGKATTGGGTFACIASEKKPREHRVYPTRDDWTKLQEVMNLPEYDELVYTFNLPRGLTDVWDDINFYDRKVEKFHSTQKPIPLMERLVLTSSNPGQTVLDIFGGSGSTGVACKLHERKFVGCEVDETYYQKSLQRIESTEKQPNPINMFLLNQRGGRRKCPYSMKNTHLEHPEDSILTGDLSVLDWFVNPGTLSVKIDGAPAVVWGTNPATGNFFVGTKSVFNKVKIKINESYEDIDANHQGNVAQILHCCLDSLPRIAGIVQGDFIGFGGLCEYTPNTLTYQFPEVVTQSIIIAPHTYYVAKNDLRDAVAHPMKFIITDTPYVKFVKPDAYILHDPWSKSGNPCCFDDVKEVCDFARQMSTLCEFVSVKEAAKIKQQINACIRAGEEVNPEDFDCDINLLRLWALVKSIKDDCLFLCRNNGPAAYLYGNRIDAEGYVLTNKFGMFKLVNREVFSNANFNLAKSW